MTGGRVVVLGPTGLNFAAGMSGGIAYVLDPDGHFAGAATTSWSTSRPVERGRRDELRELLAEHHAAHRLGGAARLLDDFATVAAAFVKVMPRDYRARSRARADGKRRERHAAPGPATGVRRWAIWRIPEGRAASAVAERDPRERVRDYKRDLPRLPERGAARAGRALHGLRRARSATTAARSAT